MIRRVSGVALAVLWAGASARMASSLSAQSPEPSSKAISLRLPKNELRTLPNGLRVIAVETHSLPVVATRLITGIDSLLDPSGKSGLAALTVAMMGEATRTKSARQVQDLQANLGTHVAPTRFTTESANFEPALALMAEFIQQPAFSAEAIAQAKAAMVRRAAASSPGQRALRAFLRLSFGAESPYTSAPDERTIAALTLDDVKQFYADYIAPNQTTLIVVGDVAPSRVFAAAEKSFGNWVGEAHRIALAAQQLPTQRGTAIYLLDVPGRNQAVTYLGQRVAAPGPASAAALDVMATMLGSLDASRIQTELRDRRGYMYAGTPYTVTRDLIPDVSLVWGFAILNEAKVDSALSAWIGALRLARVTVPSAAEMTYGRNSRLGGLLSQVETPDALANRVVEAVQHGRPLDWLESYARDLQHTTADDALHAAATYIDPDHLTIVVAGNRTIIEPLLRAANIAPVVLVDDNGRPILDR